MKAANDSDSLPTLAFLNPQLPMNTSHRIIVIATLALPFHQAFAATFDLGPNPLDFPGEGPVGRPPVPPPFSYSLTPVYPAPGGTTFSGSGASGQASGRTNFYSGFDESKYDQLAWSMITIPNPYHSSEGGSGGDMTYSGYNAATGIMTWTSTSNAVWNTAFGTQNIATRLVAQFQPFTGTATGPLGSGWLAPITAASQVLESVFGGSAGWPLVDVDATGTEDQFQVWYRFETASGTPLLSYYDSSNSLGGSMITGINGGFLVAVPEPGSLTLGLLSVGALLRRRR